MRDVRTTTGHRARPPRIGSRQPDSSLVGGALRCSARPPHRPLPRARCAVGAPACPRGRARCRRRRCGTRSGRGRNTAPFRSRAHASRRYRRARYPHPRGLRPSARIRAAIWSSPGGVPSCRSTAASAPIAEPHHSRECSVPPRHPAGGSRGLCGPGEGIMQVIRHGEQLDSSCARASIRRYAQVRAVRWRGPQPARSGCSVALWRFADGRTIP
jgi:hypothetical protein